MDAPCYVKVNAEQFIHRLLHDRYRYKRTLYIYIPGIQVWPTKLYIPTYYQCSSAGKFGKRRSYITNTITHVLVLCTSVIHTIWYKSFHIYYKVYLSKNKKSIRPPFRSSCRIFRSAQRLVLCNIVHVYSIPSGSTTHPNDLIWCCMFIGMKLLSFFVVISTYSLFWSVLKTIKLKKKNKPEMVLSVL